MKKISTLIILIILLVVLIVGGWYFWEKFNQKGEEISKATNKSVCATNVDFTDVVEKNKISYYSGVVNGKKIRLIMWPAGYTSQHYFSNGKYVYEGESKCIEDVGWDSSSGGRISIILSLGGLGKDTTKLVGYGCDMKKLADSSEINLSVCASDSILEWGGENIIPFELTKTNAFDMAKYLSK